MLDATFPVLLVIVVVESLLAATWSSVYFRWGLRVFRVEQAVATRAWQMPSASALDVAFEQGSGPRLRFHTLTNGELAFREQLINTNVFRFGYTPVMHGLVRALPGANAVLVEGRANWSPVAFVVLLASSFGGISHFDWVFLLVPMMILGFIYYVQARRYRQVARHIAGL